MSDTRNRLGRRRTEPTPRTGRVYLDAVLDPPGSVLAMAHRGGGKDPEIPDLENTMAAFRHAVALGYRYLETDVHATADGALVVMHDAVLDRVTDGAGRIRDLTLAEVRRVRIGEQEAVPTMAELLEELPECRFNIDIKAPGAVAPLAELIERTGCHDRVCVGAFDRLRIGEFRAATGGRVATAAAKSESVRFLLMPEHRRRSYVRECGFSVLQLPRVRGPIPVVTAGVVRRAHRAGVHLHVWTVDRARHIRAMIDLGVDGIFTDRTDRLLDVLRERDLWREPG